VLFRVITNTPLTAEDAAPLRGRLVSPLQPARLGLLLLLDGLIFSSTLGALSVSRLSQTTLVVLTLSDSLCLSL
jgi:hypothetical protein